MLMLSLMSGFYYELLDDRCLNYNTVAKNIVFISTGVL